jgi:hypothetical protein
MKKCDNVFDMLKIFIKKKMEKRL